MAGSDASTPTRRHSSVTNTSANADYSYTAHWIHQTARQSRASSLALPGLSLPCREGEGSLLDILMRPHHARQSTPPPPPLRTKYREQHPCPPPLPAEYQQSTDKRLSPADLPPPVPIRQTPPPPPERMLPPPTTRPPPPPVQPRTRIGPPFSPRPASKPPEQPPSIHQQQGACNKSTALAQLCKAPPPPPITDDVITGSKVSVRQDSNQSSDSFSQNSSPSYTSKSMETPLLGGSRALGGRRKGCRPEPINCTYSGGSELRVTDSNGDVSVSSPLTKSHSTPASLQTIVRFHQVPGNNMSFHNKIIRDIRRPSNHYITRGRLRFQFCQVLLNAIALLIIAIGLAAYFRAYPSGVRYANKTEPIIDMIPSEVSNPAPGICLPVIVTFCQQHRVPYNFTMFPNYIGHFTQRDAAQELEVYDALVDVRCYELAALFLCSVFVPKCGPAGQLVRPCKSLCIETKRRCGFFLDVFGLTLPDYLVCDLFPESPDPDDCVGNKEVNQAKLRANKPECDKGFKCDKHRCIPADWQCDGYVDCEDQTDELKCSQCPGGMIHCGGNKCIAQSHMCDGVNDCPWGQDERNCIRLSDKMGNEGKGKVELFQPELQSWRPACFFSSLQHTSISKSICTLLGYKTMNSSSLVRKNSHSLPLHAPKVTQNTMARLYHHKTKINVLRELKTCPTGDSYPTLDLHCSQFACGTRWTQNEARARIVGGFRSIPGDWPFLAALLGGPEQVFYCAGVLIADQWVLTASHCVGNFSQGNPSGWTIQLGITRRHAHSYFGQKMKVKRVIPHPQYNTGIAHDNDIALFQLQSPVAFHDHLLPVCLPPDDYHLKPGMLCTVIGWGKREDSEGSYSFI
ncbi:atrial natriuretic peptide-converting enzyme isoform X1 [Nilaparvata lugens]|uniref:atrial natriuretic peptide-converting enzyme isoform X1 n=2 Tax=Nilaparvata lugens TaxID=108931 RepID=UPI00193D869F|nr:atrial natriuretic peptide-converting enzyme isoform X1 [Nilaparvata lugens]XP_039290251.1 atrial natriuretic peptide-converting enzyme isoform X1 [Nilaparvata lugens]